MFDDFENHGGTGVSAIVYTEKNFKIIASCLLLHDLIIWQLDFHLN